MKKPTEAQKEDANRERQAQTAFLELLCRVKYFC